MVQQKNKEESVCYNRLSKDDSKSPSLSILNQERICREKAKEDGFEIGEVYKDIKSGTNLNRPGFVQLMSDAEKGLFNRIYIKTWDRLSRDSVDLELTMRKFNAMNITVVSCAGDNDPRMRLLRGLLSQLEIMEMRSKTEMIHQRLIKKGEATFPPPFGYELPIETKRYLRNGKKNPKFDPEAPKTFIINEKNAEIVKQIFNSRINKIPLKEIAENYKKSVMGIYLILRNKTYLGLLSYRGEQYQGKHKSILDFEIFNQVQKINEENKRNATPKIL